ncbi:MAG: sigma-70 family RNA polymerase sigma factor, partial [Bacteroidota bacterium]
AEDLEKAMQAALEQLPERCRLIFVMRRLEGIPLKEIAAQLDISPKTVENQITKALKVLKTAVTNYLEEDTG